MVAAYGITESGNFEGKNFFQRILDDKQLAEEFNIPSENIPAKLAELHQLLLKARSERVRPGTDDKVLVFWNALMLTAFSEAGRYLDRDDYTNITIENAGFILDHMAADGRLLRSWRAGLSRYNAYLIDYAGMILALLSFYQTDPSPKCTGTPLTWQHK